MPKLASNLILEEANTTDTTVKTVPSFISKGHQEHMEALCSLQPLGCCIKACAGNGRKEEKTKVAPHLHFIFETYLGLWFHETFTHVQQREVTTGTTSTLGLQCKYCNLTMDAQQQHCEQAAGWCFKLQLTVCNTIISITKVTTPAKLLPQKTNHCSIVKNQSFTSCVHIKRNSVTSAICPLSRNKKLLDKNVENILRLHICTKKSSNTDSFLWLITAKKHIFTFWKRMEIYNLKLCISTSVYWRQILFSHVFFWL